MKKISALSIALASFGFGFAQSTPALCVTPITSEMEVCSGRLEHFDLYSPQLDREMPIDVWLPEGYDSNRAEAYPVIFMHDGQNLFDANRTWNHQAWEIDSVGSKLIAEGEIEVPVVVGVYSNQETRVSDLMPKGIIDIINPELTKEGLERMCGAGVRGDLYIDFLAETLKPVIDTLYNVRTDAASTSVMGSSMGGLISINALALRPDIFGNAACVSTHLTGLEKNSIFPTALNAFIISKFPIDGKHRVYLDTGDQDLDSWYIPYFDRFVETFKDLGYKPDESLQYDIYPGAGHREECWMLRVADPLKFLVGTKK